MKSIRSLLLLFSFLVVCLSALNIYRLEAQRRALKQDLIELSNIKYGLFSVDEWKNILSSIISKKIEGLNFSPGQTAEMRTKISGFLTRTLDDFESRFYAEKSKSILGWVQGGVASFTGMFDKMKKDVPVFTEQIMAFLQDPSNRDKVKGYVMEKLTEYTDKTFAKIDYTEHNRIITLYGFKDRTATVVGLNDKINALQKEIRTYGIAVFIAVLLCGFLMVLAPSVSPWEFLIYLSFCLLLLCGGIMMPMIEIDARIKEMNFTLLGEPVAFADQVLYYKSKSILEVVHLMLSQGRWDVVMVGLLVLLFSVLFPVSKLLFSILHIYKPRLHSNTFVRFMVFRTGKWSMADVMVIAIFMSYIGFSGILTEQLRQIESLTHTIDILTTNNSSLQTGFFLFTSFAILSLLVSHRLQWKDQPG